MKNLLKSLAMLAFVALFFTACNKEELFNGQSVDSPLGLQKEDGEGSLSPKESAELVAAVEGIQKMRDEIEDWKIGKKLDVSRKAKSAVEQVEMVWNFYVSRPGNAYDTYETVRGTMTSEVENGDEMNGSDILNMYNSFKSIMAESVGDASDYGVVMIDLSDPLVDGGKVIIDYTVIIGQEKIFQKKKYSFWEKRWAIDPLGYTDVACTGRANEIIGEIVNSNLGFFFNNLPPVFTFPNSGNQKPNTFIIGPIQSAQTNFFGATFPLGGGAIPPIIINKTTDFPTGNTQATDYPIRGQYDVHGDFSIFPTVPDENCFSIVKIGNYAIDNKELGESMEAEVNNITGTTFFPYQLISTYVGAKESLVDNPIFPGTVDAYLQEHPTYHFYGRVLSFIIFEPAPVAVLSM